jgi:hypothetical protein
MLFIEWVEVRKFIYAALCLVPPLVLFLKARGHKDKRLPLLSVIPALFFCSLFVLCGFAISGANDYLPAVFSSDGRFAARVSVGPFGAQAVELFSWHGLRKDVVYYGDTDDERNRRWVSYRTLEIPCETSPNSALVRTT